MGKCLDEKIEYLDINPPSDGSPGPEAGEVDGGPRPDARAGPGDQDDLASQGAAGGGCWGGCWGQCGHGDCGLLTVAAC